MFRTIFTTLRVLLKSGLCATQLYHRSDTSSYCVGRKTGVHWDDKCRYVRWSRPLRLDHPYALLWFVKEHLAVYLAFRSQRNPDHHNIRNNVNRTPGAPFQTGFLPLLSGLSLVLLCWLVLSECPWDTFLETLQMVPGLQNLRQPGSRAVRKWKENEKMKREWGNGGRMKKWRETHSLLFLIFSLFPPSLSISYIKNGHILSQINSWSKWMWDSSASCAGLNGNRTKKLWRSISFLTFHISTLFFLWEGLSYSMESVFRTRALESVFYFSILSTQMSFWFCNEKWIEMMMIMWMTMMTMNITMTMMTTMTGCWLEIAIGKKLSQLNNVELEIKRKNFKSSNTSAAGVSILAWVKINLTRSANPFDWIGKYFWRNRGNPFGTIVKWKWVGGNTKCMLWFFYETRDYTTMSLNIPTKSHDLILSFEPQTLRRFT